MAFSGIIKSAKERAEASRQSFGGLSRHFGSFGRLFGRRNGRNADNFNYNMRESYFSDDSQAAADDEEQKKGRRGSIFGNLTGSMFGN